MSGALINEAIANIQKNHHKILDDWGKAYMAQLYQESGSIKPGDFILFQQAYDFKDNKVGFKYWFEQKTPEVG